MKTRRLGPFTVSEIGIGGVHMSIEGRPSEEDSIRAIHAAFDSGVTLVDTADVYCLGEDDIGHNERLFRKALAGRPERIIVATKGGRERPAGAWTANARPQHLVAACERSLSALGVDAIDVYQLHLPDPAVPIEDSVGALKRLLEVGKIRSIGLSNVSVEEIRRAEKVAPIVSVQNFWNLWERTAETDGVLAECTSRGIAFMPYGPLGGPGGSKRLSELEGLATVAKGRGVSAQQLVLAWMLAKSPVVLPIPGIRRPESARDSAAASELVLSDGERLAVEAAFAGNR